VTELGRLGVRDAHVIGGEAAIAGSVDGELEDMGISVYRYADSDRYRTAETVARAVGQLAAFDPPDTVFVARGDIFADALVGSPFAYARGYPVLLTDSETLSSPAARAIRRLGASKVIILGSFSAVSADVQADLSELPSVTSVERIGGYNRYETARRVARYGIEHYWATASFVGVASGADYPDALSGGASTGAVGGALILTEPTRLTVQADQFLYELSALDVVDDVCVFGGRKAVSSSVYESVQEVAR
jgi:putative cell wall-binding protein